jgi:mycothione reductase
MIASRRGLQHDVRHFDLVIIGTGSGNSIASRKACSAARA